jgi:hypothetical protein
MKFQATSDHVTDRHIKCVRYYVTVLRESSAAVREQAMDTSNHLQFQCNAKFPYVNKMQQLRHTQ